MFFSARGRKNGFFSLSEHKLGSTVGGGITWRVAADQRQHTGITKKEGKTKKKLGADVYAVSLYQYILCFSISAGLEFTFCSPELKSYFENRNF